MGWIPNAVNAIKAGVGKVGDVFSNAKASFLDLADKTRTKIIDANAAAKQKAEEANLKEAISKKMEDISNHVVSTDETEFESMIYSYLDTVNTDPLVHWGVIAASGAATGSERFNMFTATDYFVGAIPGASYLKNNKAVELLNYILKITMDPNIEGIPIGTSQISVTRDVDISESCFIVPKMNNKEYRADNAVPRLREWTINGYLSTMSSFADYGLIIKPTIVVQMKLLDTYAKSRRPVWFKTSNGTFHRVQIKHMQITQDPTMMNGAKVDIILKEYFPIVVSSTLRSSSTAVEVDYSESDSGVRRNVL